MTTDNSSKAELRKWGRKTIDLVNVGIFVAVAFSVLWVAILIWSAEGSQWKFASILGSTTGLVIGSVFVAIRRRLIAFMALMASDFSASDR
jgi:hypothetical protein